MRVPNFLYSNSFHIIIIIIILLTTYFSLGGKPTKPTIFQHFKTKVDQHFFFIELFVKDKKL